jgi:hypothetical protein
MASLPKPSASKQGAKASVLLGAQWGDEGKGERCSHAGAAAAPRPGAPLTPVLCV